MFTAMCDFMVLSRSEGHHVLTLTVYVMDGMLRSASERPFRARHELFCGEALGGHAGEDMRIDRFGDCSISWKRRNHAFHTAASGDWTSGAKKAFLITCTL